MDLKKAIIAKRVSITGGGKTCQRSSFTIRQERSALNKFTIQYTIDGRVGYIPETFLNSVKQTVINLSTGKRKTKVKRILHLVIEKVCIAGGKNTNQETAFHSNVEVNLEGDNSNELHRIMVDRIMEKISSFQDQGSNWTLKSIVSLEIHTVKYEPLGESTHMCSMSCISASLSHP